MSPNDDLLATFASDVRNGELDGAGIAATLYRALHAERVRAGIADIWFYGFSVEMELANGEHWAVECLGPNAFRLYPGIVRQDSVTWLNVWVRDDYTLAELVEGINEVTAAAKRREE